VTCECGCGYEGEDDVTQFCIEEAVFERLHYQELLERAERAPSDLAADPMLAARDFAAGRG
jgi:hypothetical protein